MKHTAKASINHNRRFFSVFLLTALMSITLVGKFQSSKRDLATTDCTEVSSEEKNLNTVIHQKDGQTLVIKKIHTVCSDLGITAPNLQKTVSVELKITEGVDNCSDNSCQISESILIKDFNDVSNTVAALIKHEDTLAASNRLKRAVQDINDCKGSMPFMEQIQCHIQRVNNGLVNTANQEAYIKEKILEPIAEVLVVTTSDGDADASSDNTLTPRQALKLINTITVSSKITTASKKFLKAFKKLDGHINSKSLSSSIKRAEKNHELIERYQKSMENIDQRLQQLVQRPRNSPWEAQFINFQFSDLIRSQDQEQMRLISQQHRSAANMITLARSRENLSRRTDTQLERLQKYNAQSDEIFSDLLDASTEKLSSVKGEIDQILQPTSTDSINTRQAAAGPATPSLELLLTTNYSRTTPQNNSIVAASPANNSSLYIPASYQNSNNRYSSQGRGAAANTNVARSHPIR